MVLIREVWERRGVVSGRAEALRRCSHCASLDHVSVAQFWSCSRNATLATREPWKACCLSILGPASLRSEYAVRSLSLFVWSCELDMADPAPASISEIGPQQNTLNRGHRHDRTVITITSEAHTGSLRRHSPTGRGAADPPSPVTYTLSSASSVHPEELEGIVPEYAKLKITPRRGQGSPCQRTSRLDVWFVFVRQRFHRPAMHPWSILHATSPSHV